MSGRRPFCSDTLVNDSCDERECNSLPAFQELMEQVKHQEISELFTTQSYHSAKAEDFYITQKCYYETTSTGNLRWPLAVARGG
jgi:hypothetical protein